MKLDSQLRKWSEPLPGKPRSGVRMQPRAQALGKMGNELAPQGRKKSFVTARERWVEWNINARVPQARHRSHTESAEVERRESRQGGRTEVTTHSFPNAPTRTSALQSDPDALLSSPDRSQRKSPPPSRTTRPRQSPSVTPVPANPGSE